MLIQQKYNLFLLCHIFIAAYFLNHHLLFLSVIFFRRGQKANKKNSDIHTDIKKEVEKFNFIYSKHLESLTKILEISAKEDKAIIKEIVRNEKNNPKNISEFISLHENEIVVMKSPKERATKLLELFEEHIEKCKNINVARSALSNKNMFNAMNDMKLLNSLPMPIFFLRTYIENGHAEGGGEAIEKIREILTK
ncbi:MAG: hypothetical protein LBK53_01525 [Heliobacteriaceae bacterium]|jgi:hypothetical protein|nr:hypothetical protein [Heliobacteriaceae bacterium]